jgi:hypothetical protein
LYHAGGDQQEAEDNDRGKRRDERLNDAKRANDNQGNAQQQKAPPLIANRVQFMIRPGDISRHGGTPQ